jgi:hypothetical protein
MAKKIIYRIFAIVFFAIFLFAIFGMALGIYNGTAKSIILFSQVLLNPKAAIDNPLGAFNIIAVALVQFFMIWIFYFIGKKLWQRSTKNQIPQETIHEHQAE